MLCIKPVTACSRSDTCFRACWMAARKPQNAPSCKTPIWSQDVYFWAPFCIINCCAVFMKVASGKETRPRRRSDQVRSSQVRWGKLGGLAFLFYARARAYTIILPDLKRRRRPGGRRRPPGGPPEEPTTSAASSERQRGPPAGPAEQPNNERSEFRTQ